MIILPRISTVLPKLLTKNLLSFRWAKLKFLSELLWIFVFLKSRFLPRAESSSLIFLFFEKNSHSIRSLCCPSYHRVNHLPPPSPPPHTHTWGSLGVSIAPSTRAVVLPPTRSKNYCLPSTIIRAITNSKCSVAYFATHLEVLSYLTPTPSNLFEPTGPPCWGSGSTITLNHSLPHWRDQQRVFPVEHLATYLRGGVSVTSSLLRRSLAPAVHPRITVCLPQNLQ